MVSTYLSLCPFPHLNYYLVIIAPTTSFLAFFIMLATWDESRRISAGISLQLCFVQSWTSCNALSCWACQIWVLVKVETEGARGCRKHYPMKALLADNFASLVQYCTGFLSWVEIESSVHCSSFCSLYSHGNTSHSALVDFKDTPPKKRGHLVAPDK